MVNTTSVHSGAPLPEADVHKVQILSFNQKVSVQKQPLEARLPPCVKLDLFHNLNHF